MARHELADQVAVLLQRAYPGELEKEELEKQSGLSNKDLRAALNSLSEGGELDTLAEHYRWRDPTGADSHPPDSEEDPGTEEENAPLAAGLGDAAGRTNRLILSVGVNFAPGVNDDATVEEAQSIAESVQNVLGTGPLADLGAIVTIRRVEVYDKPRVLFDVEGGAAQPAPQS